MEKIDAFRYLINEFHEFEFPEIIPRDLKIPETEKTISLVGSRRAGKTFYFYQLIRGLLKRGVSKEQIIYVNFEDDRLLPLKTGELNSLLEAYYGLYPENKKKRKYLFFDEIQNVKGWETFVRRIGDKEKAKVYLTGSSSKLLSREIATSLRGRTLSFYLYPFSFREFLASRNVPLKKNITYTSSRHRIKNLFDEYLEFGGFPEVAMSRELKRETLLEYFEVLIYRDLVERFSIRNTALLKRLAKFMITNISSPFSINSYYNSLKKEMKVSKETIMEYVSHLEDINLIFLVPIFSHSLKVRQVNPGKVYCIDWGLRNAVALKFSSDEGRLAENIAFIELKRTGHEIRYWKGSKEVDFVARDNKGMLSAINVSYTNDPGAREFEGLHELREKLGPDLKETQILTKDLEGKKEGIDLVPLWKWLLSQN